MATRNVKRTWKKCAICRAPFVLRKNASTAETRTLCGACRKAFKERYKK